MNMLKPQKIKQKITEHAGDLTEKAALLAMVGATGIAVWLAVKSYNALSKKLDTLELTFDDIPWDGK